MPGFDGNGNFSFTYNWVNDASNGVAITASRMDTQFNDAALGFDDCVTRDGQSPATANIPLGGFKITGLGNGTATTDAAAYGQLTTLIGSLSGFIGGLTLSTAGSSATFGIAVGSATDSTLMSLMKLASAYTKNTSGWALGTAAGSLDAGSIANATWYHVFLIQRTDTGVVDVLTSLSPTAPTLPSGYTLFRRIGSMKTDGSAHWVAFSQIGNDFIWTTPAASDINANVTTAQSTGTLNVPSGIVVKAHVSGWALNAASTNTSFNITPVIQTGITTVSNSNASTVQIQSGAGSVGTVQGFNIAIWTNISQQINLVATDSNGANVIRASAYGWTDNRGSL